MSTPAQTSATPTTDSPLWRELAEYVNHSVALTEYVKELYETIVRQQTAINTLLTVTAALQEHAAARAKENAAIVTMIAGLAATKGPRA